MTYVRDPLSEWFDEPALRFLTRAYADYGQWVYTWLPQPTRDERNRAAAMGIDVDEADPYGHEPNRWVRAFKRSARWNLHQYGYATELRPRQPRTDPRIRATLMVWDSSAGLVTRPPRGERRYQIRAKLYSNTGDGIQPSAAPADEWPRSLCSASTRPNGSPTGHAGMSADWAAATG